MRNASTTSRRSCRAGAPGAAELFLAGPQNRQDPKHGWRVGSFGVMVIVMTTCTALDLIGDHAPRYIVHDGQPALLLEAHEDDNEIVAYLHHFMSGSDGSVRYHRDATVSQPKLETGVCTWCHGDGDEQTFLDSRTHETFSLTNLGPLRRYLTRYVDYRCLHDGDRHIAVELPERVEALVINVEEVDGTHCAETDLGAVLPVPADVAPGSSILVAPYARRFVSLAE